MHNFAEGVRGKRQLARVARNLHTQAWDDKQRQVRGTGTAITSMRAAMPCACGAMSSRFLSLNVMTHCSASRC